MHKNLLWPHGTMTPWNIQPAGKPTVNNSNEPESCEWTTNAIKNHFWIINLNRVKKATSKISCIKTSIVLFGTSRKKITKCVTSIYIPCIEIFLWGTLKVIYLGWIVGWLAGWLGQKGFQHSNYRNGCKKNNQNDGKIAYPLKKCNK